MDVRNLSPSIINFSPLSTRSQGTGKRATSRLPENAAEIAETHSDAPQSDTLADTKLAHEVEALVRQMFCQIRGISLRYYRWRIDRLIRPRLSTEQILTTALKLIPSACGRGALLALDTAANLLSYSFNAEQLDAVQFSVLPALESAAWECSAEDVPYADAIQKCLIPLKKYDAMRTDIYVIERTVAAQLDPAKRVGGSNKRPPRYLTPAMRAKRDEDLNETLNRVVRESLDTFHRQKFKPDYQRIEAQFAAFNEAAETC